jgi:hypothetical protein
VSNTCNELDLGPLIMFFSYAITNHASGPFYICCETCHTPIHFQSNMLKVPNIDADSVCWSCSVVLFPHYFCESLREVMMLMALKAPGLPYVNDVILFKETVLMHSLFPNMGLAVNRSKHIGNSRYTTCFNIKNFILPVDCINGFCLIFRINSNFFAAALTSWSLR